MKGLFKHIIFSLVFIFCAVFNGFSQENPLKYQVDLMGNISSNNVLPFWMFANNYGLFPNTSNAVLNAAVYKDYEYLRNKISFSYKASIAGYLANNKQHVLVNELYGSLHYEDLQLDLGVKHPDVQWEGLSSSNGTITMSGNARAFPGYNFSITNFIALPFAKKWLSFKGNYGDFLLNDTRSVAHARLHMKSIFFKSRLSDRLELITGLNHYAEWGGTSTLFGKQPSGFKDYLRVITGQSGGSKALEGDQINALGNHVGSYLVQLNVEGYKTAWNLYWSHPFEDRSGRELMNYPDALYGFFIDFKKPTALVSHLLVEYTNTTNMSHNPKHPVSSDDNYFNNGIYQSGWTYFGNTIGSPYFTTAPVDANGITEGVIVGDNRFKAVNIGLKGNLTTWKYRTMLSYVMYYGWFNEEYAPKPTQFSGLFEVVVPEFSNLPFEITIGTAFDTGTYRPVNYGGFLKITKRGKF